MINKGMRYGEIKDSFAGKYFERQPGYIKNARRSSEGVNEEDFGSKFSKGGGFRKYSDNRNYNNKHEKPYQGHRGGLSFQRTESFNTVNESLLNTQTYKDFSPIIDKAERPFIKLNLSNYQNKFFFPKDKSLGITHTNSNVSSPEESKQNSNRTSSSNLINLQMHDNSFCENDKYSSNYSTNYNSNPRVTQRHLTVNPFNYNSNNSPIFTPGLFTQTPPQFKYNYSTGSTCKELDAFSNYSSNSPNIHQKTPTFRKNSNVSINSSTMSGSTHTSTSHNFKFNKNKPFIGHKNNYNKFNNNLHNENTQILSVNLKIPSEDSSKVLNVNRFDDLLNTTKSFCEKNNLSEKLVKPIMLKVSESLGCIYKVYNSKVEKKEEDYLTSLHLLIKNRDITKEKENCKNIIQYHNNMNNLDKENEELDLSNISCISSITLTGEEECEDQDMLNNTF